jgi:hypothetical protein
MACCFLGPSLAPRTRRGVSSPDDTQLEHPASPANESYLSLAICVGNANVRLFAEELLRNRDLRFGPKLAAQIEANMRWLENGGWATVEEQFGRLASLSGNASPQHRIAAERQTARMVMGRSGGPRE